MSERSDRPRLALEHLTPEERVIWDAHMSPGAEYDVVAVYNFAYICMLELGDGGSESLEAVRFVRDVDPRGLVPIYFDRMRRRVEQQRCIAAPQLR